MAIRDEEMSAVTVTLSSAYAERMAQAIEQLTQAGLQVIDANDDLGVVEGTIPQRLLHGLERLPLVQYVRHLASWTADYADDDSRNQPGDGNGNGHAESRDWRPHNATYRRLGKQYP